MFFNLSPDNDFSLIVDSVKSIQAKEGGKVKVIRVVDLDMVTHYLRAKTVCEKDKKEDDKASDWVVSPLNVKITPDS